MTVPRALLVACVGVACSKSDAPPAPTKIAPAPSKVTPASTAGSADVAAEPAPAGDSAASAAAKGRAYLGVEGAGLVRVADGKALTLIEHEYPINHIVIDARGNGYAAAISGTWSISGDKVTKLPEGTESYHSHLALAPNGDLWTVDSSTANHWDRKSWTAVPKETFGGQLMRGIAVDSTGRVWVATPDHLWRKDASGWTKLDSKFTGTKRPYFDAIAAGPNGEVYACGLPGLFVYEGDAWRKLKITGSSMLTPDEIAAGRDGRLATSGGLDDVAIGSATDKLRRISLEKAGARVREANVMAVDGLGRAWLSTDNGVVILDGEGKLVQQWTPGSVPGISGKIEVIAVAGDGPKLPELTTAARGTVVGKVLAKGKPIAGATVELCTSPASLALFEKTPCTGSAVSYSGVTGADGTFKLADVTVGSYGFAVKPKRTWFVAALGSRMDCCTSLENGQVYDIGSITLDKVE